MNASVEMLNRWGDNFLSFAWPMLWQSSLLIIIVFAFDFLTVKKIRASVRYALWMVVLIKLVLPPALALPTSATWWLWRPTPTIETPIAQNYSVTIDETAVPENFIPRTTSIQVPPPELTGAAWTLFAFTAIATGLLLWLTIRWLKVANQVRRSSASDFPALAEAQQLAGLRKQMRLKLMEGKLSPAVYGLFRPVILLPLELAEKLSVRQLRAVLLHEAIHLKRGDVWVNCAQTFLQIAYWWHPLLWLANARIRRLREEAVDDAVMVALDTDADAYAPTLLEVAKFTFRRPLASLGLVGIMESRSALRQRIERLVNFRPPRKAGVTLLSLFATLAFSAVALPMGQGPASGENQPLPQASQEVATNATDGNLITATFKLENPVPEQNLKKLLLNAGVKIPPTVFLYLENDGHLLMRGTTGQLASAVQVVWKLNGVSPKNIKAATNDFINQISLAKSTNSSQLEMRAFKVDPKQYYSNLHAALPSGPSIGNPNSYFSGPKKMPNNFGISSIESPNPTNVITVLSRQFFSRMGLNLDPPKTLFFNDRLGVLFIYTTPQDLDAIERVIQVLTRENGKTVNQSFTGPGREAINKKLNDFRMDIVSYQNLPLSEVIRNLHKQTQLCAPDKVGINFLFNPNEDYPSQPVDDTRINITLRLNKVALPDLLNAICLVADHPIKYSIEDYGVVFSAKDTNSPQYEMRSFKVDPKTFNSNLQKVLSPLHENDIEHAIPGPMAAASIDGSMNGLYYAATTNQVRNVNTLAQQLFSALNVNLPPPETVFFNDRLGVLFAYATPQDLKVIEHIVEELNDPRFKTSWLKIGKAPAPSENSTPVALSEIISDPTTKVDPDDLVKRTFPVDFNGFNIAVRQKTGEEPIDGFKQLAAEAGVDLSPPKTVFLDSHVLFVYAPKEDMAALQKVVDDLHCPPPQIHLKARFIEVPPSFFADFSRKYNIPTSTTNGTVVLTNPNFQVLLHEAQLQQGVEEVAEPEVTMTAGRQVEMRATIIQPVITNFVYGEAAASSTAPIESNKIFSDGSSAIVPEVAQVETGPILDATPVILYGDEKIYLQTTASQIDFLGYEDPKKLSPHYATNNIGQKVTLPIAVPLFQVREAKSHAVLYDGQTMVLFPEQEETVIKRTGFSVTNEISPQFIAARTRKVEKKSDKTLLVLVTATLMDSAGNRIHSDDQIPIAKDTDYFDPIP